MEMRIGFFLLAMMLSGAALAQAPGFQPPPQATPAPQQASAPAATVADVSKVSVSKTSKPDRDVFIGSYITIDKTCKVGEAPAIEFTQQPAQGKLRTRRDAVNLQHAPGVSRNKCLGVSPAGIAVVYRSQRKAKGDDSFAYKVTYPDGRVREVSGTVSVQ